MLSLSIMEKEGKKRKEDEERKESRAEEKKVTMRRKETRMTKKCYEGLAGQRGGMDSLMDIQ